MRGLYFDKPPASNWSLPWHKDLTIAVKSHSLPSARFNNRTTKAGVPHVEAPDEVLRQMLTLRIHLDDATPDNGPLQVLPGTHVARDAPAGYYPGGRRRRPGDAAAAVALQRRLQSKHIGSPPCDSSGVCCVVRVARRFSVA